MWKQIEHQLVMK
uniref:Uncharacterized protein n=1 Tax=Anguilla anguilla TaxID=7936 RepID=A0A0E9RYN0_ANGAN